MNLLNTFPATRVLTRLEETERDVIAVQDKGIARCFEEQAEFGKRCDDYRLFEVQL